MTKKESKADIPNQWGQLNRELRIHRIGALGFLGLALCLAGLAYYHSLSIPIVAIRECDSTVYYQGSKESLQVKEEDIKRFIEKWVALRYTFTDAGMQQLLRGIEPYTTRGLVEKVKASLEKRKSQTPKDQKIEEYPTQIRSQLTEKDALASFDRVVRINGIPIVVPSEVSLQLVEGEQTQWNPLGLYVNGVIEHEEK